LLRRDRSPADRRSVLLSITKPGEKLVGEIVQFSFVQLQEEAPSLLKSLGRILKARSRDR
jgi:DNA-binding MarR family transcriptional regulator